MITPIPEQQPNQQATGTAQKPKPRTKPRVAKPRQKAAGAKKAANRRKSAGKGARPGSKTAKILHLLERSGGATLKDLMKATD
ncbi:MAG TPA: hypothetical protein VEU62_23150, partial [Bryobacterales bacterium]|nr:hypothetical protein [Bryobacterales bacterium]